MGLIMPPYINAVYRLTLGLLGRNVIAWNNAAGATIVPGQETDSGYGPSSSLSGATKSLVGRKTQSSFVGRNPIELTDEIYFDAKQRAEQMYLDLVMMIDWNRVILQAYGIHLEKIEKEPKHTGAWPTDEICGECIRDSLLRKD